MSVCVFSGTWRCIAKEHLSGCGKDVNIESLILSFVQKARKDSSSLKSWGSSLKINQEENV